MKIQTVLAVTAAVCAQNVCAHGYVPWLRIDGTKIVPGWNVPTDPYTNNPASGDITCSIGNYLPSSTITVPVPAGGKVEFLWNSWPLGHYGPVINYMAKCPGSCSTWKGDTGTPWFKISQETYANGQWAADKLAKNNATWAVNIPKNLAAGEYLLRHEIIALHGGSSIGGAQFYPVCAQITVTGGGSASPSGLRFPGAYSATDPGILFK
ncbi:glycoside hydrolase family 61 protein [Rhizoctonia solani 123E]|uniref:lytic cellulose monooxygenase (C4-dehydrogenating) n=1 Tax=Rhizoctonia solani 123E TaxID=1423351 RepID=A0A074S6T9_9AGAM|nr:glycoside hydrolase family 61 protein [Rhizoctonia solani 123E]